MKRIIPLFFCMVLLSGCSIIFDGARAIKENNVKLVELPDNQPESTVYKIGDYYAQNGVKGVVVDVDASGRHGMLISLQSSYANWVEDKDLFNATNAFYEDDGVKNMDSIARTIEETGRSWEDFPLFAWARSLGEGWYIPAKNEAVKIWENINGGVSELTTAFKSFDLKQRTYGGAPLYDTKFSMGSGSDGPYQWRTSTEAEDGRMVHVVGLSSHQGLSFTNKIQTAPLAKKTPAMINGTWGTRAVYKF